MSAEARLYLDIDGVLLADHPLFEAFEEYDRTCYAPEVLRRLGATGLELVWLTTWSEREIDTMTEDLDGLQSGRVLQRPDSDNWKLTALIADQLTEPTAFVWVDDQISESDRACLKTAIPRTHLIIVPDKPYGLEPAHLTAIETFAHAH